MQFKKIDDVKFGCRLLFCMIVWSTICRCCHQNRWKMPPKQSKADIAKKQKLVEDKTFGLKNKSKSKSVQKYVHSLQSSVQPKIDPKKTEAKVFISFISIGL